MAPTGLRGHANEPTPVPIFGGPPPGTLAAGQQQQGSGAEAGWQKRTPVAILEKVAVAPPPLHLLHDGGPSTVDAEAGAADGPPDHPPAAQLATPLVVAAAEAGPKTVAEAVAGPVAYLAVAEATAGLVAEATVELVAVVAVATVVAEVAEATAGLVEVVGVESSERLASQQRPEVALVEEGDIDHGPESGGLLAAQGIARWHLGPGPLR